MPRKQRNLRDGLRPLALEREPREPFIERRLASDQTVDCRERVQVGELGRGLVEALPLEPAAVRLRPGAPVVDTAVQQQQLRDAVAAAHQITTHLLTRPGEMTGSLERRRRHHDRLQLPRQQQPREQLRVLAVALDPVTRGPRRLRRRDHLDRHTGSLRSPVQPKPGRARLITATQRLRQPRQPRDHLIAAPAKTSPTQLATPHIDRRSMNRTGMDIQTHIRHRYRHGRTLLRYMGSAGASLRPDKPPICNHEGPAINRSRQVNLHRV